MKKKVKKPIDTTSISGGSKLINSLQEEGTNKENSVCRGPKGSAMLPPH